MQELWDRLLKTSQDYQQWRTEHPFEAAWNYGLPLVFWQGQEQSERAATWAGDAAGSAIQQIGDAARQGVADATKGATNNALFMLGGGLLLMLLLRRR